MTPRSAPPPERHSYVTLGVEDDVFAVAVGYVREILDARPLTQLPNAPAHVIGMIDVRGITIPVIDLRRRLGLAAAVTTPYTRIMVLELPSSGSGSGSGSGLGRPLLLGLLVDRVFEVTEWDATEIEPPPDIGMRWKSDYMRGICRFRGGLVVIFAVERLFDSEEAVLAEAPG